ncbi:MAG TPA: proton-conducting transporter membrane subunit [Streptosporangiaceae bacterium]|nr:proton-conducting transporter membrane subunit [Streptosporangiaceae bacterium]
MIALVIVVVAGPLAGSVAAASGARARVAGWAGAAGAAVALACSVGLLSSQLHHAPLLAWDGYLYVDSLSCFFLFTVAAVTLLAAVGSVAYLSAEEDAGRLTGFQVRLYFIFFGLFAALMLGALETGNLGLLFVLIEASTLASAALVGLEARASALEAAWKYVIISSFGVTIALAGTLFLFYSASGLHLPPDLRLAWPYLFSHSRALAPDSLRLAFLLAVVGYGTKVGLAPMHTWLPDAHAEAPSPASAMLSAALLNTGMYAIMRFLAITRARLGADFPRNVLLTFGFLSIVIGVLFMIRQGNFKRLFAYSSVEHMGIIAVALGFGGVLGLYGALLQTLNHAIAKAVLFLTSGDVALRYRTREAAGVTGLLAAVPLTGGALLLGSFAVLGSPPFGLFLSELTIVRAGFAASGPALPLLLLALLAVAFVAFARTTTGMLTGQVAAAPAVVAAAAVSPGATGPAPPGPAATSTVLAERVTASTAATDTVRPSASPYRGRWTALAATAPLVVGLAALLVLGLWIPAGLDAVIRHCVAVLS